MFHSRTDLINRLAGKISAKSYLEIGVRHRSHNFNWINAAKKVGVDPGVEGVSEATHVMTSDEFFKQNEDFFDIIFVDGLHEHQQVKRDINNALKFLTPNGYIVCHDMNPTVRERQLSLRDPHRLKYVAEQKAKGAHGWGLWNGDCWKAWIDIRRGRPDLKMFVVDIDFGCGVITRGKQTLLNLNGEEVIYRNLNKNRQKWLNLISPYEFAKNMDANVISYFELINKVSPSSSPVKNQKIMNFSKNSSEILSIWSKSWSDNGWNPIVLNQNHASTSPLYGQITRHLTEKYPLSCYLRLLAYCEYVKKHGPTLYCDYDVIKYNFKPHLLNHLTGDEAINPERATVFLSLAGVSLIEKAIADFIEIIKKPDFKEFNPNQHSDLIHLNKYVEDPENLKKGGASIFKTINFNLQNRERRANHTSYYSVNHYDPIFNTNPIEARLFPLIHYDGGLYMRAFKNNLTADLNSMFKNERFAELKEDGSNLNAQDLPTRSAIIKLDYEKRLKDLAGSL